MRLVLMQPQLRAFDDAHNADAMRACIAQTGPMAPDDIVLLPEHSRFDPDPDAFRAFVSSLAREAGCHVVGGSHHERHEGRAVNTGCAAAPDGRLIGRYEKLRPYSDERSRVEAGVDHGAFVIDGLRVLVRICADVWFSDLVLSSEDLPDLLLVPALSVTRKSTPEYSRRLWRHLAVSRAYEFGVYVGISDWGHPSELPRLMTSGVAGFADATGEDPDAFFQPVDGDVRAYTVDRDRLEAMRRDRRARGFFWK